MSSYSVFLPSYSVGIDCYKEIPYVTRKYGKKAVVIGGKTAMKKAKDKILEGIKNSDIEILDFVWFGGDSSYENVEMLKKNPKVMEADMLFAVGGGRACDTVKTLADMEDKPFFTFPTLASNCASCTAITVIYNSNGAFKEYYYMKQPAYHTFINTSIIADSPKKLFWAGIGDALSKECEVLFASRDKFMYHTPLMGACIAKMCTDPLVQYGKKALEDCEKCNPSFELEQVALDIIISTGIVSNFATHEAQKDPKDNYYYNSSLAHCVYYGSSLIPECEKHLHGEIVSFGVLCLLTYDNQIEQRDRILEFNKSIGLPITLEEIGMTKEDLPKVAKKASTVVEWSYVPGNPTEEKFIKAILDTNEAGLKAK
ncbi:iron-containing alcohol dehydrogenase family protein [Clostridium sp. HCP1S3_B4]|uniref:iron-containing alcohol dehydrogenase family protein n=1 Tax=unclassified Clostridium TaxID=2614128 RepID=UPI0016A504E7|nr:iron-containing alcohol dehydrogenase family protein [Clostridiales bacterium]MDY2728504.1 iron-containing alcohol dehydrogenase family protein [Clostridium sp.]NLK22867.1 iron-containing alcohol dehydrogenase family protein [Clostridiales bacterium]